MNPADDLERQLAAADAALPPAPAPACTPTVLLATFRRRQRRRVLTGLAATLLAALWLSPRPSGPDAEDTPTTHPGLTTLTHSLDALADRLQRTLAADRAVAAAARTRAAVTTIDRRLAEARATAALAALPSLPTGSPR